MRIRNSMMNVLTGMISQIIMILLGFVSRTVFINSLGAEYLGVNGLFSNMLGMLSLAEAGIGAAITYNLYKPVADHDTERVQALIQLYKKAYMYIALVVFLLGLSLLPFLQFFVKDTTVEHVYVIYMIFVMNTCLSYLFYHNIAFLNVSQKGYIVTAVYSISSILATIIKIAILYYTQNYILYLVIDSFITITTTLCLSVIVKRMYPFLAQKTNITVDQETRAGIVKNVKALMLHNIGGYAVFGTDNLIIASFVSLTAVGLYSNYYMIINICRTFIGQVFDNITHSIGNLVAKESNDKVYSIFKVTMLCNFWIYSFISIFLYTVMEPLITVWIGSEYVMETSVLLVVMMNFYVSGMRRSISMVKTTSGIFQEDRYAPFVEAAVNLGASILLVQYLGITGVFLGTLISTMLVPFWIAPYLVYRKVFHKPLSHYFGVYSYYTALGLVACVATDFLSGFIPAAGLAALISKAAICIVVVNGIYLSLFYRTNEFKYVERAARGIMQHVCTKFKIKRIKLS